MPVHYIDCLNPNEGLPSLSDKSYDLGFIDPPFNIDLKNNPNCGQKFSKKRKNQQKIFYQDQLDQSEYEGMCIRVLDEMIRVCRKVVLYCGRVNQGLYYRHREPLDEWVYFMPFNTIITNTSWAGRFQPLLIFADDKNEFLGRPKGERCKIDSNVIESPNKIRNVIQKEEIIYFSKDERQRRSKLRHPCPIDEFLIGSILDQLKPKSFLDPFVGSGTTLRMAKFHNIPFLGYEIDPCYKPDIEYLLENVKPTIKSSQHSLASFLERR